MSWGYWIESRGFGETEAEKLMGSYYGFMMELDCKNKKRQPERVMRRRFLWDDLVKRCGATLEEAGKFTGGHDHATVSVGLQKLRDFKDVNDKKYISEKRKYDQLKSSYFRLNTELG